MQIVLYYKEIQYRQSSKATLNTNIIQKSALRNDELN